MFSPKTLRRVAFILFGIVLVLTAAHIVWTYVEKGEFEFRVERIRQAGDPIYMTDLAMRPVPEGQNAAALLEEAAVWLEEHRDRSGDTHLWHGHDRSGSEDWDEEGWEQATAYLEQLAPYYAMLDEIPKRPRSSLDFSRGDDPIAVSMIPQFREAVDHTHYRVAFDRVAAGRTERAARAAVFLLDLADRCELPFMIGHLVRGVVRDSDEILRLAERQPGFDARLFREIVDPRLARTQRRVGPPVAPLKEERVFALWVVRACLAGDDVEYWDDVLLPNVLWRPMLYRDACRTLDAYDRAIAECGVKPEAAQAIADRWRGEYEEVSATYRLTRMHTALPGKLFKEYAAGTAKRRLTRVVMALLEHRQTHGEWPPDLTPLGDMPLDPYSGKPFLYERRAAGARIHAAWPGKDWETLVVDDLAWSWEE